jgi:hypothetical protein
VIWWQVSVDVGLLGCDAVWTCRYIRTALQPRSPTSTSTLCVPQISQCINSSIFLLLNKTIVPKPLFPSTLWYADSFKMFVEKLDNGIFLYYINSMKATRKNKMGCGTLFLFYKYTYYNFVVCSCYNNRHQIACFKVTSKSYTVATRTAEPRRVKTAQNSQHSKASNAVLVTWSRVVRGG